MKRLFLLFALISSASIANAQAIKGRVIDSANEPIAYANVILYQLPDTTYIAGCITDTKGNFEMAQSSKNTLLSISYVGFKTAYAQPLDNQTITLTSDGLSIDEVVVKATRPISKMTASGVQTTVQGSVLSDMGTGNDVLKRIPMVTGDDGEFEVFGSGSALIYINNREVRDPSELDNLNSSDIASIEVISNPGARYDASVKAVINIKTIKKQGDGFGVNLRSSFYTWQNNDYVNQINTNYRKGGLDVFANLYHTDHTTFEINNYTQITDVEGTIWEQNAAIDSDHRRIRLNGAVGANYEINQNHSVGFRYDYKSAPKYATHFDMVSNVYADGTPYDTLVSSEDKTHTTTPTQQANIYYAGRVDKLSIDFNTDYTSSASTSQNLNTEISELNEISYIHSSSSSSNSLLASKLQLSYPIWKGSLSVGGEYVDIAFNEEYTSDLAGFTSKSSITEQNIAAFAQYQATSKYGNFSIGVRYENAEYDYFINELKDDEVSRKYGQWFPNASYSNQLGEVGIQLNYSSTVQRPTYSQLSSNLIYANSMTIQRGNPYLVPTINHSAAIMAVWKIIQFQLDYTQSINHIDFWVDQWEDEPKMMVMNHVNLDKLPIATAVLVVAPTFGIWRPQFSVYAQKQWLDLAPYGVDLTFDDPLAQFGWNNTFQLPKELIINLDARYTTTGSYGAATMTQSNYRIDFGVSKNFFDRALNIKVGIDDIFNTQRNCATLIGAATTFTNYYTTDQRQAYITVRYNFNATRSKYKGTGAGEDAKNRL